MASVISGVAATGCGRRRSNDRRNCCTNRAVAHLIAASIRRVRASTSFISGDGWSLQLAYKESIGGMGQLMTSRSESSRNSQKLVPCFPLHALLVALNQSTVDYLSLDVEGLELEVRRPTTNIQWRG